MRDNNGEQLHTAKGRNPCELAINFSVEAEVNDALYQIIQKYRHFPWKSFLDTFRKQTNIDISNAKILLIKGGFSSDGLFKIDLSSSHYVLRFMGENHNIDQRKITSSSFEWASINGFGPKIYLIDNEAFSFILYEFVEGRTLQLEDTKDANTIKAIGALLLKVHASPLPKKNYQKFSQFSFGQKWYQGVMNETDKIVGPSILKEAYKHWFVLNSEVTKKQINESMLHNDPNLRNVLLHNDKITLLDWELAGVGDPRKEVAHVCAWYGLNSELTKVFLTAYYGRKPTDQELNTLQKIKIQILLEFAWVGLSTLEGRIDQETWDKYYEQALPKTIEDLSLIQMESESKPTDEITRNIFLGLIKQFMIETQRY